MLDKLEKILIRFKELEAKLSESDVTKDLNRFREIGREHAGLAPAIPKINEYKEIIKNIEGNKEIISLNEDSELVEMAKEEIGELKIQIPIYEEELKVLLVPRDPNDGKPAIVEIRAGAGGDEAAIFAGDLFRMYTSYAEKVGWKTDTMNTNVSEMGGFKEVIFSVTGADAFGKMKFEGGTHRVQRVPKTETQGRVHTSAATVAVFPEAEDVDIQLAPADVRVDVYRASGPGGQSVNTTDSAVRLTHLPTGIIVTCQDEKSQLKNKNKAMKVLKSRLLDAKMQEQEKEASDARLSMIGSGDRSAKIRTYNYPQGRVTDHRINLTLYKLEEIVSGDISELTDALVKSDIEKRLEN